MKIDESPTKQQAVRKHIEEVVRKKQELLDREFERKKEKYIRENLKQRKNAVVKALQPSIAKLKKIKKELFERAENLNCKLGSYYEYGYCGDQTINIPEIKNENIKQILKAEFEREYTKIKERLSEKIDEKKLDIIEKILFADEKELLELVRELKEMKIEL